MPNRHIKPTPRQQQLLDALSDGGESRISELAEQMKVSHETVRRDIRPLVAAGYLNKRHGAVSLSQLDREARFNRRMREHLREKRNVTRHVAGMISDQDSIMMDTGTTTSILARELLARSALTVITNSSDIAQTLATVNGNRLFMAGGVLNSDNGAALGRGAIEYVSQFRVHYSIISIAAVSASAGLMDYRADEAEFARMVLKCGQQRMVITDHTKFSRTALVKVCDFSDIDILVTDTEPPPEIAKRLAEASVRCEIAEETRKTSAHDE